MKIVSVKWRDSIISSQPWQDVDDILEFAKKDIGDCFTCGLLLFENENHIVVILQVSDTQEVYGVSKIPRSAIIEINEVDELDFEFSTSEK